MTRLTGIRTIVIAAVVLAAAAVVVLGVMLASRSTGSAMSGMDHGSGDTAMSSPTPTTSADAHGDMPGMDMSGTEHGAEATLTAPPTITADPHGDMPGMDMSGGEHGAEATPAPAPTASADGHGDMPGMDMPGGDTHGTTPDPGHDSMAEEASPDRPIVPVLSTFGGGTSAVLLAAGFLRRKDRIRNEAKAAAHAARRSAK